MSHRENYEKWRQSLLVDRATKEELAAIENDPKEIEGRFSAMLDFGTAGLRGIMRAGLNGINVYTIRYATQGLANVINQCGEDIGGGVTIAYDSRHQSDIFAWEAASVLTANGIHVNIFDQLRPTPELSFALRETNSIAGINITASHNPKEYNGYKVYWSDGAQLPPEHAAKISRQISQLDIFDDVRTISLIEARNQGLITDLGQEMDEKYMEKVLEQSVAGDCVEKAADDLAIIYTPFHGSGYKLVPEVLRRLGMKHVLTVEEQMVIDGDFPTVDSPNPENKEGFAIAMEMAQKHNIDLMIGTDPDGDRCGIVVRNGNDFESLTGNQIGILLLDHLISMGQEKGTLAANCAVVKSVVSSPMANRICQYHNITLFETLTGFKYIGEKIKEFEASKEYTYLFGFEESCGYLTGTYARDKDAVLASMLIAEMACRYYTQGENLYQALEDLYQKYGYYKEEVVSYTVEGFDGPSKITAIMDNLQTNPPVELGLPVVALRDYTKGTITDADGKEIGSDLPYSNMLFFQLEHQCRAVFRPSGTEPKLKFYIMTQGNTKEEAERRAKAIKDAGKKYLQ